MRAGPATRVAAAAAIVAAVLYVAGAVALNLAVASHLTGERDARLAAALADAATDRAAAAPALPGGRAAAPAAALPAADVVSDAHSDADADAAPVFFWALNAPRAVTARSAGAPALPPGAPPRRSGQGVTARVGRRSFRLMMARDGTGWLVAGENRAADLGAEHLLLAAEVIAGPLVLLAIFLASLVVGLRALAPVERARRGQIEFTADASHELRTPLSVISAEADLALSTQRPAAGYRDALARIQAESKRLRRLVDDMLWLARFDSSPPPPGDEPVDLATLAEGCADRFRAVGGSASVTIAAETTSPAPALISAPPEWIDRLAGVLMDNACRHAGPGGRVRIGVRADGSRVTLTVEDSGPGVPGQSRAKLFDRFHRATDAGPGTGLGLAIGDSIVRSTGGRWRVGDSALGGALFEVSWRHVPHQIRAPAGKPDIIGRILKGG